MRLLPLTLLLASLGGQALAQDDWVQFGADGRLAYKTTSLGDRIPDFSTVGYHQGMAPIPVMSVFAVVEPTNGDATSRIQSAIDKVSKLNPSGRGQRGAIVLPKGTYRISGTLHIRRGGIVLRGEGNGSDGTILLATGEKARSLIVVGPEEPSKKGAKTAPVQTDIADFYLPVGARTVKVADPERLRPGTQVLVIRGAGNDSAGFTASRTVASANGAQVILDGPIPFSIGGQGSKGVVQVRASDTALAEVGIENLRGDSEYASPTDEAHASVFIEFVGARDAWVRQVTSLHFGYGCVKIGPGSRQVTVEHVAGVDPVSPSTDGHGVSFMIEGESCLVQHCYSRRALHDFAFGAQACGPNVYFDCVAEDSHGDSGTLGRGAVACLFDSVKVTSSVPGGGALDILPRDRALGSRGWSGANCVLWNCRAEQVQVEDPPNACNWALGCSAAHPAGGAPAESRAISILPKSLYLAQLSDRLSAQAAEAPAPGQ